MLGITLPCSAALNKALNVPLISPYLMWLLCCLCVTLFPKYINSSFKDKNDWQLHMLCSSKLLPWLIYLSIEVAKFPKLLLKDKSTPLSMKHCIFQDCFCVPVTVNPRNTSVCPSTWAQRIFLGQVLRKDHGCLKLNIYIISSVAIFNAYPHGVKWQKAVDVWFRFNYTEQQKSSLTGCYTWWSY